MVFRDTYRNNTQRLPETSYSGGKVTYTKYDVFPKIPGVNRGTERIVIGSDGSKWYTNNHYIDFIKF